MRSGGRPPGQWPADLCAVGTGHRRLRFDIPAFACGFRRGVHGAIRLFAGDRRGLCARPLGARVRVAAGADYPHGCYSADAEQGRGASLGASRRGHGTPVCGQYPRRGCRMRGGGLFRARTSGRQRHHVRGGGWQPDYRLGRLSLEPRWPAGAAGRRAGCGAHHLGGPIGLGGICALGVCGSRLRGAVDAAFGDAPAECHCPNPEHDPRRLPAGVGWWGRARGALDRSLAHAAGCLWRGGTAHRAVRPKLDCRLWQHTLYRRGVGRCAVVGGPPVQAVRRRVRRNAPGDAADGVALSHCG